MGDRVNIGFRSGDNVVFLYSHWGGSSVNEDIKKALIKAQPRWDDISYATRIAISSIVGSQWESEINFGISVNKIYDANQDTYVIDWEKRVVEVYASYDYPDIADRKMIYEFSFNRFINPNFIDSDDDLLEDPRISEFNR